MARVHLENANLSYAHLEGAYLSFANMTNTNLFQAHLEAADLYWVHLESAYLKEAHLEGASLRCSFFNNETILMDVKLGNDELGSVHLADVTGGMRNLTRANWEQITKLGDENEARRPGRWDGKMKTKSETILFYRMSVRANRQLATVLEAQGMDEEAAKFAYRAQLLHRKTLWEQRKFPQYLFSMFLSLISGYGYKLWRSLAFYILVNMIFAMIYYHLGQMMGIPLTPLEAIVFSITSFHGRGFTPGEKIGLDNPLTVFAAVEAFVGLIVEVTLIATLTHRFFKK